MSSLSLLTPISYARFNQPTWLQNVEELNDNYLSLGNLRAFVIQEKSQEGEGIQYVEIGEVDVEKRSRVIWSALKVITYATVIFPVIAFAVRTVFRLINNYKVITSWQQLQLHSNTERNDLITIFKEKEKPKPDSLAPPVNNPPTGPNFFEWIPTEIIQNNILSNLSPKDLVSSSGVSVQLNALTQYRPYKLKTIFAELIEVADQNLKDARVKAYIKIAELFAKSKNIEGALEILEKAIFVVNQ